MPGDMLKTAMEAAYGSREIPQNLELAAAKNRLEKVHTPGIRRRKPQGAAQPKGREFQRGDSVMVYPDKKIWINQKRIKLHVPAGKLYPEDYDFSIIFDSVKNRKLRHQMERGKEIDDFLSDLE